MLGCLLKDELERIWKEMIVAQSRFHPDICVGGLRKTTKDLIKVVFWPILKPHAFTVICMLEMGCDIAERLQL
jgi:hypothetical protein